MAHKPPAENEKHPSRLEAEVQEILQRADRPAGTVIKFRTQAQQRRRMMLVRARTARSAIRVTPLNLLVACVVLAILAVLVQDVSALAARVLGFAAVAALIAVFVRSFAGPRPPATKRWRGRDIEFGSPRSDLLDRFRSPKRPKR